MVNINNTQSCEQSNKTPKNNQEEPKQKCRLGMGSNGITGGFNRFVDDQIAPLMLLVFIRYLDVRFAWKMPGS